MITVVQAPLFATVQDLGRRGHRAIGVPVSGAADRDALIAVNVCVGNDASAAALEIALGRGALRFDEDTIVAVGGATLIATLAQRPIAPWVPIAARAGDELRIERVADGRFAYLAVRGGIDVPVVLGSRSTLLSAALGGYEGRMLRAGDMIPIGADAATGPGPVPSVVHDPALAIPIVRGPQAREFGDDEWRALLSETFHVSRMSDRAGYRLDGATIPHAVATDRPSEPTCVGAIQVPAGGVPIVLMHDGPTVGGYPKIAVVRARALGAFAQRAPGDAVRFVLEE